MIRVKPIPEALGAEIEGVDLREPLSDGQCAVSDATRKGRRRGEARRLDESSRRAARVLGAQPGEG